MKLAKRQVKRWVLLGREVIEAPRDHKVQLVPEGRRVLQGRPVHRDPKGNMDRRVRKEWPVHRGEVDRRVQKATKVILGLRVVPAVPLILTCKISTIFCGQKATLILSTVI